MTMELDHDLGEGTSKSVNGDTGHHTPTTVVDWESRASEWPGAIRTLVNTAFEDEDLEEAYSIVVQNTGEANRPDVDTVLQLVVLALEPEACVSPRRKDSVDEDDDDEDIYGDPYALVSDHASLRAFSLLRQIISQPGPSRLLAAIPRVAEGKIPYAPPKVDYVFSEDRDDRKKPMQILIRQLVERKGIWQLLSKPLSEDGQRRSSRSDAADDNQAASLSDRAWEFLQLMVKAWQIEAQHAVDDSNEQLRYSPSFLAQFEENSLAGAVTELTACIDIIFAPFKDIHLKNLKRMEHVETSLALLDLVSNMTARGKFGKAAFRSSFCEALAQLKLSNLQELVTSCLPDQHAAKIDLLNSYLTKYAVPSDTTFPKPKKSAPPPSSSPARPSSSAASSSRKPFSSSQSEVISIDSGTESDDSDVVCLTPIIKKTPVKKASFKPKSSPVKAKPLVSSPAKTNRVLSPQSSQDVKPNIAALSDPLLPNIKNVIEKMAKQIPRALLSLSTDAPKTRIPSRSVQIVQLNANGISITQGMINAELKFATIKLEMMRVYIAYAVKEGATALQSDWKASKADILSKALRGHRHLFESAEGNLPTDLQAWQRREQAVLDALF